MQAAFLREQDRPRMVVVAEPAVRTGHLLVGLGVDLALPLLAAGQPLQPPLRSERGDQRLVRQPGDVDVLGHHLALVVELVELGVAQNDLSGATPSSTSSTTSAR